MDTTETGGSSYVIHVGHAPRRSRWAGATSPLITLAGRPAPGMATGTVPRAPVHAAPDAPFEYPYGPRREPVRDGGAMRHMHIRHDSAQLAWIKVAASQHAQHNPNALLRDVVTVRTSSLADDRRPAARLDCCVITDGGGAIVVTKPEIARTLKRPLVKVLGAGERRSIRWAGRIDLTYSARLVGSGRVRRGGVSHGDIKYVSIYDSFTITVLITLEDWLRAKGQGGSSWPTATSSPASASCRSTPRRRALQQPPANRGGLTKVVEACGSSAVKAHPKVQVKNCDLALAHGTGARSARATAAPPSSWQGVKR